VFSRDCPEFEIDLPGGKTLILLGNHLKSQGYGGKASNDAKRHAQAVRMAQIYRAAVLRSPYVVVAGDLNAGPSDVSLAPLVHGTNLRNVMTHPSYQSDPEPLPGTFDSGTSEKQKFDYILLSPALWSLVQRVRVERRGTWRGPTKAHFPEVKDKASQASDHSCVWVELSTSKKKTLLRKEWPPRRVSFMRWLGAPWNGRNPMRNPYFIDWLGDLPGFLHQTTA
jgi:endonuclease/exonuclease/phosphatase family metal-dependent hydrolase